MRKGIANLPLHYGKAPPWLFNRMVLLSRSIVEVIVSEFGTKVFLERISDPVWFQSLGCVLGFDWHSSGLTTTVCGALKEALRESCYDLGLFVAGGKGKRAIETPREIEETGERTGVDAERLKEVSRLVAKVDNTALQDGYQLYHHVIFFDMEGRWSVVQQGMNDKLRYARRYHWFSEEVKDFTQEPHTGISSPVKHERILINMTDRESERSKDAIITLLRYPTTTLREIKKIKTLNLPSRHYIKASDIKMGNVEKIVKASLEKEIKDFTDVLSIPGLGPKSLRALALVAEIIFGAEPSFKDPVRYTFAHGGKDGHPYPVNRIVYDGTVESLRKAIEKAKVGEREKIEAIKRLAKIFQGI